MQIDFCEVNLLPQRTFKQFCEAFSSFGSGKNKKLYGDIQKLSPQELIDLRIHVSRDGERIGRKSNDPDAALDDYGNTRSAPSPGTAVRYRQKTDGAQGFLGGMAAGISNRMAAFGNKYGQAPVAGKVEPVMRSYDPKASIDGYAQGGNIRNQMAAEIKTSKTKLDKDHAEAVKSLNAQRGTMDPALHSSKMKELVTKRQGAIRSLSTRARTLNDRARNRGASLRKYYGYNDDGSVDTERGYESGFART